MAISLQEFKTVADLVYNEAAIVLDAGKSYLVESRLTSLAREIGVQTVPELIARLHSGEDAPFKARVIDAMTTNETSFFRDTRPFTELTDVLVPDLLKKRAEDKQLNVWCAASSSGQEPYTIVMALRRIFRIKQDWKLNVIASDISDRMLARARAGRYSQIEINRGLPREMLDLYFKPDETGWTINEELRGMVDFRRMNLTKPYMGLPKLDIIFVRNVLIYFNDETKKKMLDRMIALMKPDSLIIFGETETPININDRLERCKKVQSAVYQLKLQ